MKKWFALTLLLLYASMLFSQANKVVGYDYWFDSDASNRAYKTVAGGIRVSINEALDVSMLPDGLHTLTIRSIDSKGSWSGSISRFFIKAGSNSSTSPNSYEYWFDDNTSNHVSKVAGSAAQTTISEALDVSMLPNGLHTLSLRVRDGKGRWSSTSSHFFMKVNQESASQLDAYEYWFDANTSNRVTKGISEVSKVSISEALDVSMLPDGLHTLSFRVRDSKGRWSAATSQFFLKVNQESASQLGAYEYWFDANTSNRITKGISEVNKVTISEALDVSMLPDGLHTLSFRVRDSKGSWSAATSQFFLKVSQESASQLGAYEYRFDANTTNRITKVISEVSRVTISEALDVSMLPDGLHTISFRVKNSEGKWSRATSNFFIKQTQTLANNRINGYRYWIDTLTDKMVKVDIDPINPLIISDLKVALTSEPKPTPNSYEFEPNPTSNQHTVRYHPKRMFNIQFKDELGQWSRVKVDTILSYAPTTVRCDTLLSKVPKMKSLPQKDSIHFYMVEALVGDSLAFKTSVPLTIDIFDPYGKKLRTITADQSTTGNGVHAPLDGAYYALVHGFGRNYGSYTIEYTHIARYAVLGYTPKKVGNKGTSLILFEGNGFNKNTKTSIEKGTTRILSDSILNRDLGRLGAYLNLNGAITGIYDVKIDFGDTTIVIKNGFEIEEIGKLNLSLDIIGPSVLRVGTSGTYTINYSNSSNVTANVVPLYIGLNKSAEINFKFPIIIPKDTPEDNLYPYFETDQLAGVKEAFKVYCFYIPAITAYESRQLIVNIKSTDNLQLFSWLGMPIFYQEADNSALRSTSTERSTCDLPDFCDKLNLIPKVNKFQTCACGTLQGIMKTIPNLMLSLAYRDRLDKNYQNQWRYLYENGEITEEFYLSQTSIPPLENPYHILEQTLKKCVKKEIAKEVVDELKKLDGDDYKNWPDCIKPPTRHSTGMVRSCDPNDKIGYRSPSGSRYFSASKKNFTYIINFENKESATAPAQEVVVTDTLNTNIFELDSFRAGYVKIGSRIVDAPYDAISNIWNIDMRPKMNLRTNVKMEYDSKKGIASWHFTTIDPMTGEKTTDPLAGFLPPNDTLGTGQGSVSFSINLKDIIDEGASIKNRATIVFDNNEAIVTPSWDNIKDITAPESTMQEPTILSDDSAILNWIGQDNKDGSGIYRYNIFVKKADEPISMLLSNTPNRTVDFSFKKGIRYKFFVTAVDSAGNVEVRRNIPDAELFVQSDITEPVSTMSQPVILSDTQATLSWQGKDEEGGSGIKGYTLYSKKGDEAVATLLVNTALTTTSFTYEKGIRYQFYVTAEDNAGNVEIKNRIPEVELFIPKDVTTPVSSMSQPVILSDTQASLSWQGKDEEGGSGIKGYTLYAKNDDEAFETLLANTVLTTTTFTYEKGIRYQFYVTAEDNAGNVEVKKSIPEVELFIPKDVTAPVSSMSQPVVLSDTQATLSWQGKDEEGGSGIKGYTLYAKKDDEAFATFLANTALTTTSFTYEKGIRYQFYVTAEDNVGNVEVKKRIPEVELFVPKDVTAPVSTMSQPVILSDTQATLSWQGKDEDGGSGVKRYNLFVKKRDEVYTLLLSNTTLTTTNFIFEQGIKYQFYVTAEDNAGNIEVKTNVPDITLLYNKGTMDVIKVYPNPSDESTGTTVEFILPDESLKKGKLIIASLSGSVLKVITPLSAKMIVKDIGRGVFFFNLQINSKSVKTMKIIVM